MNMGARYDNLRPATDRAVPRYIHWGHERAVRRLCESVRRRTGEVAWFDVPRAELCFGHTLPTDPSPRIVLSVPLFRDFQRSSPIYFDPARDCWDEDTIVRFLNYAKAPAERKAKWRDEEVRSRASDENERQGVAAEKALRPAIKATERAYERHSMGKHYRGRAAVNGLRST